MYHAWNSWCQVVIERWILTYRGLDHVLRLFDSVSASCIDKRNGRNIQHAIPTLLRQSVYSRLAGYEDANEADLLSVDPVMWAITGKRDKGNKATGANTMGPFETDILTQQENFNRKNSPEFCSGVVHLSSINGLWVQKAMGKTQHNRIILDMDSSVRPVHG